MDFSIYHIFHTYTFFLINIFLLKLKKKLHFETKNKYLFFIQLK